MKIFFLFVFVILCAEGIGQDRKDESKIVQNEVESPPISFKDFRCGTRDPIGYHSGIINGKKFPIYHLNTTAEQLLLQGFEVNVQEVKGDVIVHLSASNGTFNVSYEFSGLQGISSTDGKLRTRTRAFYMAQLGFKNGENIDWLCEGVLISPDWILSSAHCFSNATTRPNLVRLGDYDLNEPEEQNQNYLGKFIYDYEILNVISYPAYQPDQRYHDLALIQIPKRIPIYSSSINPVCLPWGNLTNENLVGTQVTLTGWGETRYDGNDTALLQEAALDVFPTSVCEENYTDVYDVQKRFPNGMDENTVMCVGLKTDDKDTCASDSGSPIAYEPQDRSIVLVGIMSSRFLCDTKEYPGLYIPINKPKYLQWIKDVAFKDYV